MRKILFSVCYSLIEIENCVSLLFVICSVVEGQQPHIYRGVVKLTLFYGPSLDPPFFHLHNRTIAWTWFFPSKVYIFKC